MYKYTIIIKIGGILVLYIYNKTSIKRNILTINKIHREVRRVKDLSTTRYRPNSWEVPNTVLNIYSSRLCVHPLYHNHDTKEVLCVIQFQIHYVHFLIH